MTTSLRPVDELFRGPPAPDEPMRGDTWAPVDLDPYLTSTYQRPEPTIGVKRNDGLHVIYPGKEHTIIGEMESGKSWVCIACAAAELHKGRHVVYIHFEEADPIDTLDRLRVLGVSDETLRARFHFVGPNEPRTLTRLDALVALQPSLVILDGVNEAMAMHDMSSDTNGVATYRAVLVKPFTRAGAAVLSADHVAKDPEKRGRYALGPVHKGNGITGSLILLENVEPFGRGERGVSHVFITKDRPGYLRRHGRRDRKVPGKTYMGTLIVDDTDTDPDMWRPRLKLVFAAPAGPESEAEDVEDPMVKQREADEAEVLAVVAKLNAEEKRANSRTIRAMTTFSNPRTDEAVDRLVVCGALLETAGRGTERLFKVPPEDPPEDPPDELFGVPEDHSPTGESEGT